jgi:RNA polymerase sigma factor (TIGR02999 family)
MTEAAEEGAGTDKGADEITGWVERAARGDLDAEERLYRAAYGELRRLARAQRRRGPSSEALTTTALVHEFYLRLQRSAHLSVDSRRHFYSLAARAMRQLLIDEARRAGAARHGGGHAIEPLALAAGSGERPQPSRPGELLELDAALGELERLEPALARLVELHFFAGLSFAEIAALAAGEGRSERTLRRDWRRARAFLRHEMGARS